MRFPHILRGSVTGAVLLLGMSLRFASTPCLLGASLCCVGTAMEAAERGEPRRTYNLPRGDAASTLRQFATVSGRPVFFMMDKVQGEQTNAIAGDFTPAEALDRMLAGTALAVLQQEGDEEFVVGRRPVAAPRGEVGHDKPQPKSDPMNPSKPFGKLRTWLAHLALAAATAATAQQTQETTTAREEKDEDVLVLTPFTVSASSNAGYGATTLGSSGRLSVPYIDTAQSVSVVTSELLTDAKLTDTAKAVQLVPNVQTTRGNDITGYQIRGIGTGPLYVDGFVLSRTVTPPISTAFADRFEIVKGPSATAYGRGDPAGFINYILKSPKFAESTEINTLVGSGSTKTNTTVAIDNNGFVTSDRKTAYRFNAEYSVGSGTQEPSWFSRAGALLSVDHRIADRGNFEVTSLYIRSKSAFREGGLVYSNATYQSNVHKLFNTPTPPLVSPDFSFSYSDDGLKFNHFSTTAVLNYKLTDTFFTRQAFSFGTTDGFGQTTSPSWFVEQDPNGVFMIGSTPFLLQGADEHWSYQCDFLAKMESSWLQSSHSVLVGGDFTDQTFFTNVIVGTSAVPLQPYLDWNPNIRTTYSQDISKTGLVTKGTNWSPYIEAQSTLLDGRIRAAISARYVYFDQSTKNRVTGAKTLNKYRTPLLPMASLLYKPKSWLSVYGLFSKYEQNPTTMFRYIVGGTGGALPSTDPRSTLTITQRPATENREIGLKANLLGDKLTLAIAAFDVETGGAAKAVFRELAGNIYERFIAKDTVQGWEVQVFGRPTDNLTFMLGGGIMNTESPVPQSDGSIAKLPFFGVADTVNWYVKYALGRSGFSARCGGKVFFSGWCSNGQFALLGDAPYPDTVSIIDLGLSYRSPRGGYEISLDVKNAFHEQATIAASNTYSVSGRQIFAGVTKRF